MFYGYSTVQNTSLDRLAVEKLRRLKAAQEPVTNNKKPLYHALAGAAVMAAMLTFVHPTQQINHNETYNNYSLNVQTLDVQTLDVQTLDVQSEEHAVYDTPEEQLYHDHVQQYQIANWIHTKYRAPLSFSYEIVRTVVERCKEAKEDPYTFLALVAVESNFVPSAVSNRGAQGITQVRTSVHGPFEDPTIKGQADKGLEILAEKKAVSKTDDIKEFLQRYNGNLKDKKTRYSNKVLDMRAVIFEVATSEIGVPTKDSVNKVTITPISLEQPIERRDLSI